jgi:hypothetical protein
MITNGKEVKHDETMLNPAVKLYRDKFRKTPNRGLRLDIIKTVTDLALWLSILNGWRYQKENRWIGKNPLAVKAMLDEYDRLTFKRNEIQSNGSGVHRKEGVSERTPGRVQKSELPTLYAGTRL